MLVEQVVLNAARGSASQTAVPTHSFQIIVPSFLQHTLLNVKTGGHTLSALFHTVFRIFQDMTIIRNKKQENQHVQLKSFRFQHVLILCSMQNIQYKQKNIFLFLFSLLPIPYFLVFYVFLYRYIAA